MEDVTTRKTELVSTTDLILLLRRAIPDPSVVIHDQAFINNIAYALQYIDHLIGSLSDPELRTTIHSQTCKSVVLAGMGVVEAILWFVVRRAGKGNTSSWQERVHTKGPEFKEFGKTLRMDAVLLEQVTPPIESEMTLDTLIKKVEKGHLLGLENKVYGTLKTLRQLRNRIHIHDVGPAEDTDWYKFTGREVVMLLNSLNAIFDTPLFSLQPHHRSLLQFLNPDRVERRR